MRMFTAIALAVSLPLVACGRHPQATVDATPVPPVLVDHPTPPPTVAPLVAPSCAQRIVQHGSGNVEAAQQVEDVTRQRTVAFLNRCGFPIRVLYAAKPSGKLTELTAMLQPNETSKPTRIADDFDQPSYVVCSYEHVPATHACRLRGGI
jgi:hypothetical protein